MKKLLVFWLFVPLLTVVATAQKVFHARIDKTDLALRGAPVVLGQVNIVAPTAGKVVVRFDGDCISSVGDRIFLAASNTAFWGGADDCIQVKSISTDLNSNVFSHTRVYDVVAGSHTFYAVAENYSDMTGSGKASVYGSLTVEWFPEITGQAFVRHQRISKVNFNVEGATVKLAEQAISTSVAGKVVVRFDGYCISNDGDLLFLAAGNAPYWGSNDGSTSIEIADDEFNKNSFAHVRTYDVGPGNHTYYAVIENFYETYGNGIASVYGSLTVSFYPENTGVTSSSQGIVQVGTVIDNGPATLSELVVNAPADGKVVLNFTGTCIGSFGDYIKLAANDTPNWGEYDGSLGFEPFSSDRNRTSFSHTRVFEVGPGEHHYYAVAQNVQEFFGSGLVVVYGHLNATFYPNASVAASEPSLASQWYLTPNPVEQQLNIHIPDQVGGPCTLMLFDAKGQTLRSWQRTNNEPEILDVSALPAGCYFVRIWNEQGHFAARSFMRL